MLHNRYAQVALTYTMPWMLRVWAACAAAFVLWLLCLREANFQVQCCMLMLGGTLAGWIGPMITSHAKEQLADSRGRLTPNFVAPHLIVAAAFFVIGVGGMTWFAVARLHQLPAAPGWPSIHATAIGLLSIVLLATTVLALMSHTQSTRFILFIIILTGFDITIWRDAHIRIIAGELPATAISLILLCMTILAGLWWRLGHMHEEMAEFWRTDSFNAIGVRKTMTGDRHFRRAAAAETGKLTEWLRAAHRLDSLANVFAAPFWRRVRHWRLVVGMGKANWALSLTIAASFWIIYRISQFSGQLKQAEEQGLFIGLPLLLSVAAPIMGTGLTWPLRWLMLGDESLRPVSSRGAFLREQGAAMAMELFNLWLWFTIGAFITGVIARPSLVLTPHVAGCILLSALVQVWLFGATVWLLRFRLNVMTTAFAIIIIVFVAGWAAVAAVAPRATHGSSPLAAIGVGLAALGVIAMLDAYRRWLVTDLD